MMLTALLAACVPVASAAAAAAAGVTLTGDVPWVVAGDDPARPQSGLDEYDGAEPIAFQLALRDVQLDWYRVLGHPPPLVPHPHFGRARRGQEVQAAAAPARGGYEVFPGAYCTASYHPSTTTPGATLAECRAKCDATGCACFDISDAGRGDCRTNLHNPAPGTANTSKSSNRLDAYVYCGPDPECGGPAPPPPPPPPPPAPPPPPYAGPAVYFGTLQHCPWLAAEFDLSSCELHKVAAGESSVTLLHPPPPLAGAPTAMRGESVSTMTELSPAAATRAPRRTACC